MKLLKLPMTLLGLALAPILISVAPAMSQEALKPIAPKFSPDPQVYAGQTGGDVPLQSLVVGQADGKCKGVTQQAPSHFLTVQKNFGYLNLKILGDRNLSLLVKGPDGIYCRSGKSPELAGAWLAGKYSIWVGSIDGTPTNYKLSISETSQ